MSKTEKAVAVEAEVETKDVDTSATVIETKQETKTTKTNPFAKYANVGENALKGDYQFNTQATAVLNDTLSNQVYQLTTGEQPSAKYLVQHIEAPSTDIYRSFLAKLLPEKEIIGTGLGAEYILTNDGIVNAMDSTKFIPNEVGIANTHVDSISLTGIGGSDKKTKQVERSIQLYRYLPYYLSGKFDEVANIIRSSGERCLMLNKFEILVKLLAKMFTIINAKNSSTEETPTNRLVGAATNPIDAMKEFKDFIFKMLSHNTQFNYGKDKPDGSHTAEEGGYNNASLDKLRFIVDYQTFNNIEKYLPFCLNSGEYKQYFSLDKFIVIPDQYPANDSPNATSINDTVTLTKTKIMYNGDNRVKGAIMVVQAGDIKHLANYSMTSGVWYQMNNVTQLVTQENYTIEPVKWAQVAVYENEHLEDEFAIPVKQ